MIQIITSDVDKYKNYSNKKYKISNLTEIQALDDFEICIIDLNSEILWRNVRDDIDSINSIKDLKTIKTAMMNSQKTTILIVFPQNRFFKFNYAYSSDISGKKYNRECRLKDIQDAFMGIINNNLILLNNCYISFEKSISNIDNQDINADFYFSDIKYSGYIPIVFSKKSNKITTIMKDKRIITTLDILRDEVILGSFIEKYCIDNEKEKNIPEWIKDVKILNDEQLEEERKNNLSEIQSLTEKNEKIDEELDQNLEYKSILYSTGNELVKVVLKMLDEILENDSSTFVDEKKEDFLIKKDDVTFIGEIKGVNTSVNNGNVSQLDNHVQNYIDLLDKKGVEENVKGLLIINHQRTKPLEERQEVHEHQIKLATRNCALIIESQTLLNIYESYRLKKITGEEIKNIFKNEIGLLKFE